MGTALVIVESPAKARTIAEILGRDTTTDYVVEASVGHIRDLPRNASEVPDTHKGETWARMGVDVDNGFKPLYVVSPDRKSAVTSLKRALKGADQVYLATDEDREGEAIAWHLLEVLNPRIPVKRMVFHEITPAAIQAAIDNPRDLDRKMVDAQEARRILDRLYGYEVSPVLWRKVLPRLSAGRVQSVATRIVVQRERERMKFVRSGYWDVDGQFASAVGEGFGARLVGIDGKRVATGRDFGPDGVVKGDVVVLDSNEAHGLARDLTDRPFAVESVEAKPYRRSPAAPFITSTLQQEAGRKLRLSSAMAMRTAQGLYERGYITYMRTDSTTLSETALAAARSTIVDKYGSEFLPPAARHYRSKSKNAQEAHEAIRPAGEQFRSPQEVAREVNATEARLYEMIWQRTVASQMTDALGETVTVKLGAATAAGRRAEFSTSGTVITHAGFQRVYVEDDDDEVADGAADEAERRLPQLAEGDSVTAVELEPKGHETSPPARYTEASLVKQLEELGVGRPSTYASIMSTIVDRGYVWKKGSALIPSWTAFAVVKVLEDFFPDLVDYAFTARMEDDLDGIADGSEEATPWLERFYFGAGGGTGGSAVLSAGPGPDSGDGPHRADRSIAGSGLKLLVSDRLDEIDPRIVNAIFIGKDSDDVEVNVRVGRYGPYLTRGEDRAGVPEDLPPDELDVARALEILAAPSGDRILGAFPDTDRNVSVKTGRFGAYVQLGEDDEDDGKPKRASLFSSMSVEEIDLETALQLLTLPRTLGVHDGEDVVVANGRFGPFVKAGKETRSLASEDDLLSIELEQALEVLAQPKQRRGQVAKPPMKAFDEPDPVSGKPMVIKDGRFGPYVTDGETNASLRKGDDPETLAHERAVELMAERRAKIAADGGKKPARRKPAAKGAVAKKAPAKKAPAKKARAT